MGQAVGLRRSKCCAVRRILQEVLHMLANPAGSLHGDNNGVPAHDVICHCYITLWGELRVGVATMATFDKRVLGVAIDRFWV